MLQRYRELPPTLVRSFRDLAGEVESSEKEIISRNLRAILRQMEAKVRPLDVNQYLTQCRPLKSTNSARSTLHMKQFRAH